MKCPKCGGGRSGTLPLKRYSNGTIQCGNMDCLYQGEEKEFEQLVEAWEKHDEKTRAARNAFDAYKNARAVFDAWKDEPGEQPEHPASRLQLDALRWQIKNFGVTSPLEISAGVTEEVSELLEAVLILQLLAGKLAHVSLKHTQNIRGLGDRETFRKKAADAIADIGVFSMQFASLIRCDYWTLLEVEARNVLKRDWVAERLKLLSVATEESARAPHAEHLEKTR